MERREKISMKKLVEIIEEEVTEPRHRGGNLQHKLVDVLSIILVGIVCGCNQWIVIEDFAYERKHGCESFWNCPMGFRVMIPIVESWRKSDRKSWIMPYVGNCLGKQVVVDGKTICGASQMGIKLHIVSAWVREDGLTLGQVRESEKSNEITAIPKLLNAIELGGATVSMDAMGCQTAIAEQIVNAEAN